MANMLMQPFARCVSREARYFRRFATSGVDSRSLKTDRADDRRLPSASAATPAAMMRRPRVPLRPRAELAIKLYLLLLPPARARTTTSHSP